MPKRNVALYIDDILDSISAIQSFTNGLSFEGFAQDRKTYSATIREYIVIGEAIVALKEPLESRFPDYSWRMIKDFRNFIVHEYFGIHAFKGAVRETGLPISSFPETCPWTFEQFMDETFWPESTTTP